MKLNWGWGIVIALASFIAFIMYFFIKGHFVKQDDLVSQEYYDEGLQHDDRVQWIKNAQSLSSELIIEKYENGNVGVILPDELQVENLNGEIAFKRMNNAKMDVVYIIENESMGSVAFVSDKFLMGNYRFKAKIEANGKTYYWDKNYTY
jgi:hypothetical protein